MRPWYLLGRGLLRVPWKKFQEDRGVHLTNNSKDTRHKEATNNFNFRRPLSQMLNKKVWVEAYKRERKNQDHVLTFPRDIWIRLFHVLVFPRTAKCNNAHAKQLKCGFALVAWCASSTLWESMSRLKRSKTNKHRKEQDPLLDASQNKANFGTRLRTSFSTNDWHQRNVMWFVSKLTTKCLKRTIARCNKILLNMPRRESCWQQPKLWERKWTVRYNSANPKRDLHRELPLIPLTSVQFNVEHGFVCREWVA